MIIIVSTPEDPHAAAVAGALKSLGRTPLWLSQADIPGRAGHAFTFLPSEDREGPDAGPSPNEGRRGGRAAACGVRRHDAHPHWTWTVEGRDVLGGRPVRSVWLRRLTPPGTPAVHPDDAAFAERELEAFLGGFWQVAAADSFWVNPPEAFRRGERKALQLREAHAAGLRIPATLIGNEPTAIRAFVRRHAGRDGAVYKAFMPFGWQSGDGRRLVVPTTPVTPSDLPDDDILRAVPGIYQQRVRKRCEVRLTMFGDFPVAVRIPCEEAARIGEIDWRAVPLDRLALEPCAVPDGILDRVRLFMRRLGIVFGCFDFIVTPGDEWVFLEVNQMGQFLWIEARNPAIPMLAHFCALLLAARRDFAGAPPELVERVRFRDHASPTAAGGDGRGGRSDGDGQEAIA